MDESRITTIEQVEPFLAGNSDIEFLKYDSDEERYAHISRVMNCLPIPKPLRPIEACFCATYNAQMTTAGTK